LSDQRGRGKKKKNHGKNLVIAGGRETESGKENTVRVRTVPRRTCNGLCLHQWRGGKERLPVHVENMKRLGLGGSRKLSQVSRGSVKRYPCFTSLEGTAKQVGVANYFQEKRFLEEKKKTALGEEGICSCGRVASHRKEEKKIEEPLLG